MSANVLITQQGRNYVDSLLNGNGGNPPASIVFGALVDGRMAEPVLSYPLDADRGVDVTDTDALLSAVQVLDGDGAVLLSGPLGMRVIGGQTTRFSVTHPTHGETINVQRQLSRPVHSSSGAVVSGKSASGNQQQAPATAFTVSSASDNNPATPHASLRLPAGWLSLSIKQETSLRHV